MKLAKAFDPTCQRQLIVASKIDKYDKGIVEKLQGRGMGSMELQLGCVAVLNRNQEEIDKNISFNEMKEREKQFFIKHKETFQHLPDELKGSEQLVRRLATIQQERIRSTFPDIIKQLRKQIVEKKAMLKTIPSSLKTETECWTNFQSMINDYRERIHDNVKGEYDHVASTEINEVPSISKNLEDDSSSDVDLEALDVRFEEGLVLTDECDEDHIAYHIYHLQRNFQRECKRSFSNFFSSQYHKIVLREIDRTAGVSLPNFPSYQIIVGLFRKQLQKRPNCCFQLVERIHEYMSQCLIRLLEQVFTNAQLCLKEHLKEVIIKRLNETKEVVSGRVSEILEMEQRVFTLNHYYMDTVNQLKEKKRKKDDNYQRSTTKPVSAASTFATMNSTATVPYTPVTNEAQAAIDIQIALYAYFKVK